VDVGIRVVVDARGNVSQAEIESVSVQHRFADFLAGFALNAARQWKFRPATVNGKPVPGSAVLRFRLSPSQR
jgi:TonB family protein